MTSLRALGWASLLVLAACSRAPAVDTAPPSAPAASSGPAAVVSMASDHPLSPAASAAAVKPASSAVVPDEVPAFTMPQVAKLLLLAPADVTACADGGIACLLRRRYQGAVLADAERFASETGGVLGLERAHTMDGGYRGAITIVPEVPEGRYERHRGWVLGALREHDQFFAWLGVGKAYRHRPLALRFFRSVGKHTPAAYAIGWQVGYNVEGGLNTGPDAVRETLFHEVFHLNDQRAEGASWSVGGLGDIYDRIVARCGARTPCLTPYAPSKTTVRNGTYYAFQPGNGVTEYAAELALRYYIEHRRVWRGEPVGRPFRCGPDENREAWERLVAKFFAGVDRVPPCAPSR